MNQRNYEPSTCFLAYYGDDFTGSTDVLEALDSGGIETVLFVEPPSDEMLQRYPHVRAFGIAGNSRTMSPQKMDAALPEFFAAPAHIGRELCITRFVRRLIRRRKSAASAGRSTSASASFRIGSCRWSSGSRAGRFCVFGNLFARSGLEAIRSGSIVTRRCGTIR